MYSNILYIYKISNSTFKFNKNLNYFLNMFIFIVIFIILVFFGLLYYQKPPEMIHKKRDDIQKEED